MCKYIIVTGGVVSSLGKGITAASLGRLLINRGHKIAVQKLDPYLNVDPGTMSPYQHGEVFVTHDGMETDLDIGHYERFLDMKLDKNCNHSSGKIYSSILSKERKGLYLGATIQVVPHVTNEIKDRIKEAGKDVDALIVEIGGTVGDIEGLPFLEAVRQLRYEVQPKDIMFIHVVLLPYLEAAKEVKTKPAQHSVKELTSLGIQPDILVCRTNSRIEVTHEMKQKLAMFCNLPSTDNVIHIKDAKSLYEVPLMLQKEKLDSITCAHLDLKSSESNMDDWKEMVAKIKQPKPEITVGIVGKYTFVADAYLSITESIHHAALLNNVRANVKLIDAEKIESEGEELLHNLSAIIVAGGFGNRGIAGKLAACKYARENNIPFLGLCLGMQIALIEIARNVANIKNANSTEFDEKTSEPVICLAERQKAVKNLGGTMRLGEYTCNIQKGTKAYECYQKDQICERHRHRHEFNNEYKKSLENVGVVFSGINEDSNLVEIVELNNHKFFMACQFHPEFVSRPYRPHPLFAGLIKAAK